MVEDVGLGCSLPATRYGFHFVRPQRTAASGARCVEILRKDVGENQFSGDGGFAPLAVTEKLIRHERAEAFELGIVIERFSFARAGEGDGVLRIEATARVFGRTGVEMEALTAVSVAALTVYDMCKAVDRTMTIECIRLEEKSGGRSGRYRRRSSGGAAARGRRTR